VLLWSWAFSCERGTPVQNVNPQDLATRNPHLFVNPPRTSVPGKRPGLDPFLRKLSEGRCKATWKTKFKLPRRDAGPLHHHDDKVDLDQQVVNKELPLSYPLVVLLASLPRKRNADSLPRVTLPPTIRGTLKIVRTEAEMEVYLPWKSSEANRREPFSH